MSWRQVLTRGALAVAVLALAGVVVSIVLNVFVLDRYAAYGEIPIPGEQSLWLPAGEVTVTFHTRVISGPSGGGLPVPDIQLSITPPDGVPSPTVTDDFGSTTTVNNDSRRRVGSMQVAAEGSYTIRTDGPVGGFIAPRLAFGHGSPVGRLPWAFGGLLAAALVMLAVLWRR